MQSSELAVPVSLCLKTKRGLKIFAHQLPYNFNGRYNFSGFGHHTTLLSVCLTKKGKVLPKGLL